MPNTSIEIKPVSGALGAKISGIDMQNLDDSDFTAIHDAFLEYLVVFFRDQDLSPKQHKALSSRFGALYAQPYLEPNEGHPEVIRIVKQPDDDMNFAGSWHADLTYLENPVLGAVVHAREVPTFGGDTMFANLYLVCRHEATARQFGRGAHGPQHGLLQTRKSALDGRS